VQLFASFLLLAVALAHAHANEAQIAVAANFAAPAQRLAAQFEQRNGHRVRLSTGSTGKFYAQIRNGAPFDVLLAADHDTPQRLAEEKRAPGAPFTYAIGKLVLWSPHTGLVDGEGKVLATGAFKRLAMANPKLAPYGRAAEQAMQKLGVRAALEGRIVMGESIAQAFQFVASGNAELGFVALSQLRQSAPPGGSAWLVPQSHYAPIRQDAVLLAHGEANQAAREFLEFLRSSAARGLIARYGYELP
jgi:molybdate transport system substrate-binding protein